MEGATVALMGILLACTGEWERGCAITESAMRLHPNFPGWYWLATVFNAYRIGDYRATVEAALRIQMPGYYWTSVALASAYGQLGEHEAARKAVKELRVTHPNFSDAARQELEKWFDPALAEHFLEGLNKAGLQAATETPQTIPPSPPPTSAIMSGAARSDEGFWVAVLPFKHASSNADLAALADGLTDDVITNMSRFSYLRVIARSSTARYAQQAVDVRTVAKELGARYVMDGSVRQAGSKIRVAVQLVDASTGASLWAETYDRVFTAETMLDLLDDVVPRIVATVGDTQGILAYSMTEALRQRDLESLTPYEALLRSFGFHQHVNASEHLAGITALERAVKQAPDRAECWAMLSWLYRAEYTHEYNPHPDPMDRSLAAARRAVELAPSSQLAHAALASAFFFRREFGSFRAAAERALALNSMEGYITAFLGMHFAFSGDWERGCGLAERATQLNPNHPGWYWLTNVYDAYRRHDSRRALEYVLKVNMPGLWTAQVALATVHSQAGQMEQARMAMRDLLKLRPDFGVTGHKDIGKWWLPDMAEQIIGDLRKAGLEITDKKSAPSGTVPGTQSIAVLPFANLSADPEQEYFSDGLAEEIINLLAQVPALKVIARTSAFAFRGKEQDIRGIAETLGVSTILEGSVRRSGSRIRVTAQLINAADGSHLWSERYDRELSDIFALQDEISAAIAKALRIKLSREVAAPRYTPRIEAGQYSVHEAVSAARTEVERALQIDSSLADGHALLGYLAALFDSDWAAAEKHFEFPLAKQASFELVKPMYGGFLYLRGNADQAIKLAERAIEEDPLDVWAHMNLHAYLQPAGREDEALAQLQKVVELDPNQVVALASMVMIHADKGEIAQALKIARRAYAVGRWFPDTVGLLAALLRRDGKEEESTSIAKELGSGEVLGRARAHALFHLICGEIDQAADWVQKAIEQRDSSMRFYLGFVICRGLRASHRWPKIAKMVNLPACPPDLKR
jgi:TolB-like protein/Flp pilus assembly protein TadD